MANWLSIALRGAAGFALLALLIANVTSNLILQIALLLVSTQLAATSARDARKRRKAKHLQDGHRSDGGWGS